MKRINNETNATVNNNAENNKSKKKKPFYKKWKFWLLLLIVLVIGRSSNDFSEGVNDGLKEVNSTSAQMNDTNKTKESKNKTKEKAKNDTKEKKNADEVLKNFQENLDKTNAKLIKKEISEFLYIEIGDGESEKEVGKTKINSVKLKDQKLRINLDTSEVNIEMLDNEATAMLIAAGVTEELLRHDEFDMYWDTVTVNFEDIGKITYKEDDVEVNKAGGFRQFPVFEDFANGKKSFK